MTCSVLNLWWLCNGKLSIFSSIFQIFAFLFRPFGIHVLGPKDFLNYLVFQFIPASRLFQKRVVCTKLYINVFITTIGNFRCTQGKYKIFSQTCEWWTLDTISQKNLGIYYVLYIDISLNFIHIFYANLQVNCDTHFFYIPATCLYHCNCSFL